MTALTAVFLDRDGTLVDDPGFLRDPGDVRLLPGAPEAVALLKATGFAVIIVTNQSGIGRGLLTEAEYEAVETRVLELLAARGGVVDGVYHCPHNPEDQVACDCRKPGTRLYRDSSSRFGVDLRLSWWVGDRLSDLEPSRLLGGRGVLVETGRGSEIKETALELGFASQPDILAAAHFIVAEARSRTERLHQAPPLP